MDADRAADPHAPDDSATDGSATVPVPIEKAGRIREFFRILGPGLVTGASDDDPSGIGTYAAAGAAYGYGMLWTALVTYPLMAGVQFICAKVGLVSGRGLTGVIRIHYRVVLFPVVIGLVAANTFNAAADISAIAAGINLLVPIPIPWLLLPITLSILAFQVWGSYRQIARIFKWLCLTLLTYIGAAILAQPDWLAVLGGTLIPTFRADSGFLMMLVAILGTTISPYLFFWQANQEVEEEIARDRKHPWNRIGATDRELRDAAWDVDAGMALSNVVMFFIILAAAATLNRAGRTDIGTAAEAAEALRPLAGDGAFVLMALGLIGTGVLAVPILIGSASYAVAEAFEWECSLEDRPSQAKRFYLVMSACFVAALAIDYAGMNPMKALVWSSVINGFLSPPLLVIIMLISNNRKVMGERVNSRLLNTLGWATTILMFVAAIALIWSWIDL
jgi:NRAMP (natural resistance-associated macrophage protein)-like metal ion transporter